MDRQTYNLYKDCGKGILDFMEKNGISVKPYPTIKLNDGGQKGVLIKTGYYDPEKKEVVIYTKNRNPKDCLRSMSHEFIHHNQNLEGRLNGYHGETLEGDDVLENLESEAYMKGNIFFRKWTEEMKKSHMLDESKKIIKNDKGELVPETCDKCGGKVVCQIHGEPVYACKDCGKYFDICLELMFDRFDMILKAEKRNYFLR